MDMSARLAAAPRLLLTLLATAVLLALGTPTARAHDELVGSTPEDGASMATGPAEIGLEFSSSVLELGTEIAVTGPGGSSLDGGALVVDGSAVTMPLPADLAAGAYTVDWRATSSDGHPISGSFRFTVETWPEPAPVLEQSAPPEDTETEPAAATEPAGSSVGWIAGGAVVLVVLAAGLAVWQLRRRA